MPLKHLYHIDLPPHPTSGGFDHAAVHTQRHRLYVAHTANNALDIIDCVTDRYLHSIPDLAGVAGALVSESDDLIFTSNRAENTVGIFRSDAETELVKIAVGYRPNGLAYDPQSRLLLAAHVGDPTIAGSTTIALIHVDQQQVVATIIAPGRTRWTIFDAQTNNFYVNIADPALILAINATQPDRIAHTFHVPVSGPHGLDLDTETGRLFCACDGGQLVVLSAENGAILGQIPISGVPDVIFYNADLHHLYVAVGDPGVIDVFDTHTMHHLQTVTTEKGAHTLAFDPSCHKLYAFLPETHRAAVYLDED